MNSARPEFPREMPEWRRIGPFLVFAAGLHLAVLLYPLRLAGGKPEIPPPVAIMARLVEAVSPPAPLPIEAAPAYSLKLSPV